MASELNTGFPIYVLVYIYIYFRYMKNMEAKQIFWFTSFVIYLFLVIDITIFPIPTSLERIQYNFIIRDGNSVLDSINLIPNLSLNNILSRNFFLNMVMFAPFGFLINVIFIESSRFKKTFFGSLMFTLSIELTQLALLFFTGSFKTVDIDDIVSNILGSLIGLLFFSILFNQIKGDKERKEI
ncbi:VanZ family protein [Erysipelothrix inopinata]|uniref:VanZ family protein n=1 Tax=Erysipelothrix inopinata TaxID=225084 RepID=A0A7G9RW66_9FIRM|nr:VanZ family protein [Erysipelothrix inopinata]QNN59841.1 VanZ family protein [Erysipelothrix inopinata]